MPDNDVSDTLVAYGSAVKALGDDKIGGYLVLFGSAETPDLQGEYFDRATDYGIDDQATSPVLWNHGGDPIMKRKRIGKATLGLDDVGVWIEAQLQQRDDYERAILKLAQAGKLGWSSGTASHLVDYDGDGKSARRIVAWPLGLDASLTPTPADPRNHVLSLKSLTTPALADLLPEAEGSQPAAATKAAPVDDSNPSHALSEGHTMSENTITLTEDQLEGLLTRAADKAIKALPAPPEPTAPIKDLHDRAEDKPWGGFGEFLIAVKDAYVSEMTHIDPRLRKSIKAPTGLNEGVDSAGGFLVDQTLVNKWVERMYQMGQVMSRVPTTTVGPGANGIKWNGLDETSRATGSRWGGVRAYWGSEAGSPTASKPTFKRLTLDLEKIYALYYATEEELQDASGLEARVSRYVENEIRFTVENAVLASGTGVGQPLSVLNAACLVSVTKETGQAATTVVYNNLSKMWARMWAPSRANAVWFVNQDVEPQLDQIYQAAGTAGIPPSFVSYTPEGVTRIKGRPVVPVEYCSTLGTVGDIILADMSQYAFIDKGNIQSASSIHVQFVAGETAFRFVYRCNGMPEWSSALTPLNGSSSTLSPFVALATRA